MTTWPPITLDNQKVVNMLEKAAFGATAPRAKMEVERQNDLARLKVIQMVEAKDELLQEKESKSDTKESLLIDPGLRKEKLALAARQLERQKLALILLLQDTTSLTNSRA